MEGEHPTEFQVFLWLLTHGKILTNYERWKRRLSSQLGCERCWTDREDAIYVTRDCRNAKEVWEVVVPPDIAMEFFNLELRELLALLTKRNDSGSADAGWPKKMMLTYWWQ